MVGQTLQINFLDTKVMFKLYFSLDVMADPGLGNQGHYMMFYINQQQKQNSFGKEWCQVSNVPQVYKT